MYVFLSVCDKPVRGGLAPIPRVTANTRQGALQSFTDDRAGRGTGPQPDLSTPGECSFYFTSNIRNRALVTQFSLLLQTAHNVVH